MTLRCKPGDLAVCIEGTATGTFVTVVEPGVPHPFTGLPSWACKVRTPTRVTLVDVRTNRAIRSTTAPAGSLVQFLDKELQPIRPKRPPIAIPAPPEKVEA